jgi:hypothetical protein
MAKQPTMTSPRDYRRFTLSMGCLSPRIEEQLSKQSLKLDMSPLERQYLQHDVDAVSRLLVRGVLTELAAKQARWRIMGTIGQHLKPMEQADD